jgi:Xaa-Pro aminopeptidase
VPDSRPRRLAALRDKLVDAHFAGLLISSLPNIRYLTGFSGSNALLVVTESSADLVTDFRYELQASDEVSGVAKVRIEPVSLWNGLWHVLAKETNRPIAFESAHLLHRDFQRLCEEGTQWQWRPTTDVVESLRERKDPEEVDQIRRAAAMATAALATTLDAVHAGMTELQVAGVLERSLREEGAEAYPFASIVATGARTALPHARAGDRAIAPGDFLLLDFGATAGGYCADVTRTVVVGRASDRQRSVYNAVREANELAREGVRAGMRGKDADAIARDVLSKRGLGEAFGHGLGHGLGLEVHEAPRLSRVVDAVLPDGAVVTIEPGAYIPGWGGVRIEDDVHLVNGRADLLTDFPRELLELV